MSANLSAPLATVFFGSFDPYTCEGDTLEGRSGPFRLVATIYRDDDNTAPHKRQDGFWPSLDPKDAGYIGAKSESTLARHMKRAQDVLTAWRNDEWFYVGVAVRVFVGETPLTGEFDNALWGIDCNYPTTRRKANPNAYLGEVAEQLVADALSEAREVLASLADTAAGLES